MGFFLFVIIFFVIVCIFASALFGLCSGYEFASDYRYLSKSEYLERLKKEKTNMFNTWGGRLLITKYLGFVVGELLNRRIK